MLSHNHTPSHPLPLFLHRPEPAPISAGFARHLNRQSQQQVSWVSQQNTQRAPLISLTVTQSLEEESKPTKQGRGETEVPNKQTSAAAGCVASGLHMLPSVHTGAPRLLQAPPWAGAWKGIEGTHSWLNTRGHRGSCSQLPPAAHLLMTWHSKQSDHPPAASLK
jgi:hypothetical protein